MTDANAVRVASPADERRAISALILSELQTSHGDMLAAMALMDALTGEPVSELHRHPNARWRLSRAGLKRSIMWRNIYDHMKARIGAGDAAELQSVNSELMSDSTAHIGKWTADKISLDWPGYCEAYRAIHGKLTICISAEKRILYLVLEEEALSAVRR